MIQKSAVIVLSHHLENQTSLNKISRLRADRAAEIFRMYQADYLITSGWQGPEEWGWQNPISQIMKNYLSEQKFIPTSQIFVSNHARDTVGDAYFTRIDYQATRPFQKVYLVTSEDHIERAEIIFQFIYGAQTVIISKDIKTPASNPGVDHEKQSLRAFQQTMAGVSAGDCPKIAQQLYQKHPYYNGKIYPRFDFK